MIRGQALAQHIRQEVKELEQVQKELLAFADFLEQLENNK